MRALIAGLLCGVGLLIGGCGIFAPFQREVVDNRDPERVRIDAVRPDATIDLADGRRVRLFGLDCPREPESRRSYLARIERLVGEEATVNVALDGETPAVELRVWKHAFICGNGLGTWNPDSSPIDAYHGHQLAANLAIDFEGSLRESDLMHPNADPLAVRSLRDAHDYGIRHRAGTLQPRWRGVRRSSLRG